MAVVVLVICKIIMFTKFAVFVSSTIFLSIFYSLFFFAALCHTIGPNKYYGNFSLMYASIKKWQNGGNSCSDNASD